jgi:Radical SAM superfamily
MGKISKNIAATHHKVVKKTARFIFARCLPRKLKDRIEYHASKAPARPCHLDAPFVTHDGYVYPCCRVWGNKALVIGHIDDAAIARKIISYKKRCWCSASKLVPAGGKASVEGLYIEVSLACQGKCAMCCVFAPEWHGSYAYYESLEKLIAAVKPKTILVQGGEVLIQKKTLEWLFRVRRNFPSITLTLTTNGNADLSMIETVRALFDKLYISIVGFQPETYQRIMGLDVAKTIAFVEQLHDTTGVRIQLKYMSTPINIHEAPLYFDWAIGLKRAEITFADTSVSSYVRYGTFDDYWNKIFARTELELKRKICAQRELLEHDRRKIFFDAGMRSHFRITPEWIRENKLENLISDSCS